MQSPGPHGDEKKWDGENTPLEEEIAAPKALPELIDNQLSILVVDDNEQMRKTACLILKQAIGQIPRLKEIESVSEKGDIKFKPTKPSAAPGDTKLIITTTDSGEDTLELIKSGATYDLIILDDQMAHKEKGVGITGEKTTALLREWEQSKNAKANVILTCSTTYKSETGSNHYPTAAGMIEKPMEKKKLLDPNRDFYKTVAKIMEEKRLANVSVEDPGDKLADTLSEFKL